ncbi:MAG: hypothetical protein P1U83_01225 [Roseovarius sp.]|nr:hypothetical protein [Roseovarius sp.]
MSTQVQQSENKKQTLSEKALRLLAAHDRETKNFDRFLAAGQTANRWA